MRTHIIYIRIISRLSIHIIHIGIGRTCRNEFRETGRDAIRVYYRRGRSVHRAIIHNHHKTSSRLQDIVYNIYYYYNNQTCAAGGTRRVQSRITRRPVGAFFRFLFITSFCSPNAL